MNGRLLSAALLAAGCSSTASFSTEPAYTVEELEAVLADVRAAVGQPTDASLSLQAEGTSRYLGCDGEGSLLIAADGRFVVEHGGVAGSAVGHDGRVVWERSRSGITRRLLLESADHARLVHWVHSGYWLRDESPLVLELLKRGQEEILLSVGLPETPLAMGLSIDPVSFLPREVSVDSETGTDTWTFGDYRRVDGRRLAHRIEFTDGGRPGNWLQLEALGEAPHYFVDPFAFRPSRASDTEFRSAGGPLLVERNFSGHLLVRPFVEGEQIGWFIFDTGASAMVITPAAADALGLEATGELAVWGAGGQEEARMRLGKSFELGALSIRDPLYIELDLDFLDPFFEVELVGICGYDVLARSVVELEAANGRIALYDPGRYELADDTWVNGDDGAQRSGWEELVLDERLPCVKASFEGDHAGLFKIDTGAPGTVTFHTPVVRELQLTRGRSVTSQKAFGVGGEQNFLSGRIDWFELGGHRFEKPNVTFAQGELGALADRYTLGNIGQAFLKPFRIVFDYGTERIAFRRL